MLWAVWVLRTETPEGEGRDKTRRLADRTAVAAEERIITLIRNSNSGLCEVEVMKFQKLFVMNDISFAFCFG